MTTTREGTMRHYDHHHTTAAEARACDAQRQAGTTLTATKPLGVIRLERAHANNTRVAKATATATTAQPAWLTSPANPKRVSYAGDLLRKYPTDLLDVEQAEIMMNVIDGKPISAGDVDKLITAMQAIRTLVKSGQYTAPQAQAPEQPAPEAKADRKALWAEWRALAKALVTTSTHPSGARFAIENLAGANDLSFWWISEHNGFCKLRQVIGGGRREEVRDPQRMIDIAKRIEAAGPYEAMIRYGQEIGACGHCGRDLTNEESRAAGIGPICRNK